MQSVISLPVTTPATLRDAVMAAPASAMATGSPVVETKSSSIPAHTVNQLINLFPTTVDSDSDEDLDDLKLMKRKDIDTTALAAFFKNTGPEMFTPPTTMPTSKDQAPPLAGDKSLKGFLGFFSRRKGTAEDVPACPSKAPAATKTPLRIRRKKPSPPSIEHQTPLMTYSNVSFSQTEQRFQQFHESYSDVKVDENGVGVYRRKIKVCFHSMDTLCDDNGALIASKASLEEELEGYAYKNMVVSVRSPPSPFEDATTVVSEATVSTLDSTTSSEASSPTLENDDDDDRTEYFPVVVVKHDELQGGLAPYLSHHTASKEHLSLSLEEQVRMLNQELFQERRRRFRAEENNRQTKLKCDQLSLQACKALKLLMSEKCRLEAKVQRLEQQQHQQLSIN